MLTGSAVPVLAAVGLVLAVAGFAGVLVAQEGMGASWRTGVDEAERTKLVTGGAFARVRNPIFTTMLTAQLGFALLVPTWLALTALACLAAAVQLQVRVVEEPHLLRAHSAAYRDYAAHTGRYLPGIGRLPRPQRAASLR